MQRLFSNFADGWPGRGLLLHRLVTGAALVHCGIVSLRPETLLPVAAPHLIASLGGILLLAGLWTPVAGSIVAVTELWIAFSNSADPWVSILLATLGTGLAMLGPGAWSIDARLFGRKHIETSHL